MNGENINEPFSHTQQPEYGYGNGVKFVVFVLPKDFKLRLIPLKAYLSQFLGSDKT